MRAGPLSDSKVIDLINRYFVPVYTSNEDYRKGGPASDEERAEADKIYRATLKAKMSAGTVHVYLATPEGVPVASMHVAEAAKKDKLIETLERVISEQRLKPGETIVKPQRQSGAPKANADSLVLHLTSRSINKRGCWTEFPGENWIVVSKAKLLRADPVAWDVDAETAEKILTHFYPATENNDVKKNQFERLSLKASAVSTQDGVVRARLEGEIKMKHSFYHKDDGRTVEATAVGYVEFEPTTLNVRSFKLVSDKATYGECVFGVAVYAVDSKQ